MKPVIILLILIFVINLTGMDKIDLAGSIEIARSNNRDLKAGKESLRASSWSEKNALTGFLPSLDLNLSAVRIDSDYYDDMTEYFEIPVYGTEGQIIGSLPLSAAAVSTGIYKTSYNSSISVQQPVFNGGKQILAYQIANLNKKQNQQELYDREKDLEYNVASVYFSYLKLEALLEIAGKDLNSAVSHLEMIRRKYELGTVKKSDLLQWQVKYQNDLTNLMIIENELDEVRKLWNILLGVESAPVPKKIEFESFDPMIERYAGIDDEALDKERDDFISRVKAGSALLRKLELSDEMMKKNYYLALSDFLPSLNLQFTYEFENDDRLDLKGDENWNLAAMVTVPLFHSGRTFTRAKQVKHEWKSTRNLLEESRENYLISAENVFNRLVIDARKIRDNRAALQLSRENHRIVNDLYEQGMVTNSELLDAETMLSNSEVNLISAYYDFIITDYEKKKYLSGGE